MIENKYEFRVPLNIASALPVGTIIKVSAIGTVGKAAAGEYPIGSIVTLPDSFPGNAAVRTPYGLKDKILLGGSVTFGEFLKIGTDGTNGEQRLIKFTPGTDNPLLMVGVSLGTGVVNEYVDALLMY